MIVKKGVEELREVLTGPDVVLITIRKLWKPLKKDLGHCENTACILGFVGAAQPRNRERMFHIPEGLLFRLVHDPAELLHKGRVDLKDAVGRFGKQPL